MLIFVFFCVETKSLLDRNILEYTNIYNFKLLKKIYVLSYTVIMSGQVHFYSVLFSVQSFLSRVLFSLSIEYSVSMWSSNKYEIKQSIFCRATKGHYFVSTHSTVLTFNTEVFDSRKWRSYWSELERKCSFLDCFRDIFPQKASVLRVRNLKWLIYLRDSVKEVVILEEKFVTRF